MDWRIVICDLSGNRLSDLTRVGSKRQFQFRWNKPATFSFEAPSDAQGMLNLQGGRVIKAWRAENPAAPVIRYAGYVWNLSDVGDADTYKTKVVCFDPLQRMARRLCRDSGNAVPANGIVSFVSTEGELIIRGLIGRSNAGGGVSGLTTSASGPSGHGLTVDFEWRDIAAAITEICQGTGLNVYVEPQDTTDGYLGVITIADSPTSVAANKLVWGGPTHNASRVERTEDMTGLANDLHLFGVASGQGTRPIAARTDSGSITTYGRYEDVMSFGDITQQGYLDALADKAIALRKSPRILAKFTPQPDPGSPNALNPFTDFKLGYLVDVYAGPKLRGGFSGQQRIWGFDIDLDDNAVERVSAIYTGADA
jgi:hypothetical protein